MPLDVAVRLCRDLLGIEPHTVERTRSPVTFRATAGGTPIVIKLARPGRPASPLVEAWAYRQLADRGALVPTVLATSADPECTIVSVLPGRSLWKRRGERIEPIWAKAGEDLLRLHEVRVGGFGPAALSTRAGPHDTAAEPRVAGIASAWCPFIDEARREGLPAMVDVGRVDEREAHVLDARLAEVGANVASWDDGRLLHGDLEGGHVFADDDLNYTGMIDFDQAQVGDPRWDLARVRLWDGDAALDALLDGYGRDALSDEDRRLVLPVYLLAFSLHHAVRHVGNDAVLTELLEMTRWRELL